jgi:hypothetical protein
MKPIQDTSLLKKGDVLFTFNKTNCFSKIIWKFTGKKGELPVSHVAIYLGDDLLAENTLGVTDESWGGVMIRNIAHYNKSNFVLQVGRVKKVFDVDVLTESAEDDAGVVEYSFFQLIWAFFEKVFRFKAKDVSLKASVCSEWVIDKFRLVGVDLVPGKMSADAEPREVLESKELDIIKV